MSSPDPRVTIAIPTYNRAASYLPLTLTSALAQSYEPLEILVADNGSTDGTAALVESLADPRVIYRRHPANIGANANYNYCLEQARGDYFMLLHDDDLIDADFVAGCMEAARHSREAGIICTGIRVIDESGNVVRECRNEAGRSSLADFYRTWFAGRSCWYLANTLFHTRRLREHGGFHSPYRLSEDGFAIAGLARFDRINIAAVKASFRVHNGEQTFASPAGAARWALEYLRLLDRMCALVEPEEVPRVRREGRRFFAQRVYNRAAAERSRTRRWRAYYEVFRLFGCRHLPPHRSRSLRFIGRAWRRGRRLAQESLGFASPASDFRSSRP